MGDGPSTLLGSADRVSAANAALANGMCGHADEIDDSHLAGRFHPGCAIVPAALAVAERERSSSAAILRAIALGYDIGARANMALGFGSPRRARFSTHTLGALFGASAAAASLLKLNREQSSAMLSYAVQQASGLPYWSRDPDHIEKAFDFGGKGARDGVYAALMADAGFTAAPDPMAGERGYLEAFAENPSACALVDELGTRFEIGRTSLKKWCAGSPIQSVLDALEILIADDRFELGAVERVKIEIPSDRFHIVDDRDIPAICVQHLAAVMLLKGTLTYDDAHDGRLMEDREIREVRNLVAAVPSDDLAAARPERQAIVEIFLAGGGTLRHHTKVVKGTPENPMTAAELSAKATGILGGMLGDKTERLIGACLNDDFRISDLAELCRIPQPTRGTGA